MPRRFQGVCACGFAHAGVIPVTRALAARAGRCGWALSAGELVVLSSRVHMPHGQPRPRVLRLSCERLCGSLGPSPSPRDAHPTRAQAMRSGFQVDAALRVHDVAALRIADASVAPAIPSAPTQVLRRNILDYTHYRCRPVGYCGVRGAGYVLYDWASCSRDCARLHGTMTQRLCSPARRHYAKLQPVCGNCGKT